MSKNRLGSAVGTAAMVIGTIAALPRSSSGTPAEPRQLLQQAMARFDEGAFLASRELLLEARTRAMDSKLLGQIALYLGLNEAVENRPERARGFFREALSLNPLLQINPERFKPSLVALFRAVVAEMQGRLIVPLAGTREPLFAWIDGQRVGALPVDQTVVAGGHEVQVQRPNGAVLLAKTVLVPEGGVVRVALPPGPSPLPGARARPTPQPAARDTSPGDHAPRRPRRIWTWVAGAGALVFLVTAIATGASASADHDDACSLLDEPELPCESRSRLRQPSQERQFNELRDAVQRKALTANLSYAAAAVLAVGSALLYWYEGRQRPGRRRRSARIAPWGSAGAGLAFDLRY